MTKDYRRISGLRKGVVCLAADKKGAMGDRENCQCTNLHSQLKSKGPIDKTRSISVQSRRLAVVETLFDSDNRRFSCSDALVKYIPHARNRGLILKTNSNTVQNKRRRPCKNERTLMGSSDSVKTLNWEAIPYDEENVGKLVEVYGKNNVGKTSFLQHLQPTTENIEKGTTNVSIIESFIFFLLSFFLFFLTTLIFSNNVSHFALFQTSNTAVSSSPTPTPKHVSLSKTFFVKVCWKR